MSDNCPIAAVRLLMQAGFKGDQMYTKNGTQCSFFYSSGFCEKSKQPKQCIPTFTADK